MGLMDPFAISARFDDATIEILKQKALNAEDIAKLVANKGTFLFVSFEFTPFRVIRGSNIVLAFFVKNKFVYEDNYFLGNYTP